MGLKMATKCTGHHAKRVMVAHLAGGGHIGRPQKYFVRFGLGPVRRFRISSLCTNVPEDFPESKSPSARVLDILGWNRAKLAVRNFMEKSLRALIPARLRLNTYLSYQRI
jgi:hypothetical protein